MRCLGCLAVLTVLVHPSWALGQATIVPHVTDGATEGFNDPTVVAAVGGNPGTTLGQQRLNAFNHAAAIWGAVLKSSVTITIDASFDSLSCTGGITLGQCGPNYIYANFPNAPLDNTWYLESLANSLAGEDQNPGAADMHAAFNSDLGSGACAGITWYYGYDGNEGPDQIDFVAVLLHEFAHGLGFMTLVNQSGAWFSGRPDVFAHFIHDNTVGLAWDQMTDGQRATSAVNPRSVVWSGSFVFDLASQTTTEFTPGVPAVQVTGGITATYDAGEAEFGAALTPAGVAGAVVVGADGVGTTSDGCETLADLTGKIALLDRGTCDFTVKVKNAQIAHAVGVLIVDNTTSKPPGGLAGTDASITIPSVRITQAAGAAIRNNLPANASLLLDESRRAGVDDDDRPYLWTPSVYEPGSSVSHWDVVARPNLLMEPYSNADERHGPDVTLPLLRDIGWACPTGPDEAVTLGARFTNGTAKLEWQNGTGTFLPPSIRVRTDGVFPGYTTDGAAVTCGSFDGSSGAYNSCIHSGLTNNTTYRYRLLSKNSECYSVAGPKAGGAPFDTGGFVKWAYATGAASLSPPGLEPGLIGTGAIYAVSNDNILHAMNSTASGGDWPRTGSYSWLPFVMNAPSQHYPIVLPVSSGTQVLLASQDGYAYSVDATTGAEVWTSPKLGEMLQSSPVGFFSEFYPGAPDLLFVGTRNTIAANALVALSPSSGAEQWRFTNSPTQGGDGTAMGIVTGAMVSYGDWKVYFTTRARTGGSPHTVWCIDALTGTKAWSVDRGEIDGAPVIYDGRVYVGAMDSRLYVLDAANAGATLYDWRLNDGAIKGYVVPHYGTSPVRMFVATNGNVWAFDFGVKQSKWKISAPAPSVPLLRYDTGTLYFGDGAGALHQVNASTGSQTSLTLGSSALGAPAFDYINNMIHIGSTAGAIYGVAVPF